MTKNSNSVSKNTRKNSANNSLSYWSIVDKATQIVLTTICCDTREEAEKHLKMLCKTHKLPSKAINYEVRFDFTDSNGVAIYHEIQPKQLTATQEAAAKAAREAEREAAKAARKAYREDRNALLNKAQSLNQALKTLQGLEDEKLPSGITVGEFFSLRLNIKLENQKLTVSAYRAALNKELVKEDGIYTWKFSKGTYSNGVAEDENNGKAVEYYDSKSKTWKKAGSYKLVKLDGKFTAKSLIALIELSINYETRRKSQLKAENAAKNAKRFRIETARKSSKGSLTISYEEIEKSLVKF